MAIIIISYFTKNYFCGTKQDQTINSYITNRITVVVFKQDIDVFHNIGPGKGNGVTDDRYIDQVLQLHSLTYFAQHQNNISSMAMPVNTHQF